ncbi:MAG TPA: TadE/TadG family type IV pilus assembly protein [Gaiellaceae bacterium]|nr:TadE/TadG family type IV pilus assembly protein [Gaiellaceae bacterium]
MVTLRRNRGALAESDACEHCTRQRERGQVIVLFALLIPVLFALTAIVLDVGNWYVHKRKLQTLVDAGAFAGATKFVGCSFQFGDPVAANAAIKAAALAYAGDTARDPATMNLQVQEPQDVRVVLNSARFWTDGDPTNGAGLDDTRDHDGDPMTPGDPCTSKTLDVKATDDDAPLLFGLLPVVVDPKSKARVEIRQIKEQAGMLPWAVPDAEPAAVAAIFVDENTGAVTATQLLCSVAVCAGLPAPDNKLSYWVTPVGQDPVDIVSENTGVVILVSKIDNTPSLPIGGPGTLTDICTQSPQLVTCYAGDGNQDGLTFVHGWSDAPVTSAPQIRDVSVIDLTCSDDLSAPYFLRAGDCDLGAMAVIDFGNVGPGDDPTTAPPNGVAAQVVLNAPGCGANGCQMQYQVGSGSTASIWITTQAATLGTAFGRADFSIEWQTEFPAGVGHAGTFSGVAHPYVADTNSGPIDYLQLSTWDAGVLDANSRNIGPDRSVVVTAGMRKPLTIEDPLSPPILLRVASPSGSQNQAFDCDKTENFATEIENGCKTAYALNYDDWSNPKDGLKEWADILCETYGVGDLPPDAIVNDPTPICVAVETGDKIGQFRQGLTKRFENPTCWPNNWPKDQDPPGRGPEDDVAIANFFRYIDETNDQRYVTLIITDYETFQSQGNDQVPVKYFAGFYATGWDVVGNVKACLDNDPHPWYGSTYRQSLDNGDVWGHFVNIVKVSSAGLSSDELCNFDALGNCIAVLVE